MQAIQFCGGTEHTLDHAGDSVLWWHRAHFGSCRRFSCGGGTEHTLDHAGDSVLWWHRAHFGSCNRFSSGGGTEHTLDGQAIPYEYVEICWNYIQPGLDTKLH